MSQPEELKNDYKVALDEDDNEDKDIYINQVDGLSNEHPSIPEHNSDEDDEDNDSGLYDDLPTSVIVTNIHPEVFTNEKLKIEMEDLFKIFSENATFQWLKSFRRLRVNLESGVAAANARLQLHQYEFGKSVITCYFAQPVTPVPHKYLKPPALTKQFLISPPASPPAGWCPREEGEPLVNHDLLAALANLTPGESHELHPPTTEHPGIIVHTALMPSDSDEKCLQNRIPQTKCPERAT